MRSRVVAHSSDDDLSWHGPVRPRNDLLRTWKRCQVSSLPSYLCVRINSRVSALVRSNPSSSPALYLFRQVVVEGRIMGPPNAATAVHLNGGKYSAFVRTDGSFSLPAVPAGTAYLLEVVSTSFVFEQVCHNTHKFDTNFTCDKSTSASPHI